MATVRDNEAIVRLKRKGDPALWAKIYQTYKKMDARQNLAISLPPVGIQYTEVNYTPDLNNAKAKAAEYAYAKGTQLLKIDNINTVYNDCIKTFNANTPEFKQDAKKLLLWTKNNYSKRLKNLAKANSCYYFT